MRRSESYPELEAFAKERIAAHRYPNDYHIFTMFRCPACGVVPFTLTIEHHTGSRQGDFKGIIFGQCSICGDRVRVFSFTGQQRNPLREEKPVCGCGNEQFTVGECERIERDDRILGFFDEGVVVGQCSRCGQNRVLVHTD